MYIGDVLGYERTSTVERARVLQIVLHCTDYISEGRSSFHTVGNKASYRTQEEEGKKASKRALCRWTGRIATSEARLGSRFGNLASVGSHSDAASIGADT